MRHLINVVDSDWSDASTNIATSQVEGLLARAELSTDPVVQATLLTDASALYEAQAQTDHAFLVRCTAYRLAPNAGGRAELERLAALTGRLAELDALLTETTPGLPPDERAQASCDLGRLRLRRLRSPDRALEALDLSLALRDGGEAVALRADALEELGRWSELATVLVALADAARSKDEATRILMRLADAFERGLGDPARAEEVCRHALANDPGSSAARSRLERMIRARGDLGALLALVEDRLAITPAEKQEPLLREAAELCEKMGSLAEAADHYEELRTRHPGDLATLRALERLYGAEGRLRKQIAVLEDLVGLVESKREHAAFHRKLAAAWTEVGEPARAIESFEWLLSYEPTEPVFQALDELYRAEGRYGALADAYARHLRVADPRRRRALRIELAAIYERHLHDVGQAIGCWQALLDEDEGDAEALEALGRLYEGLEDFERAGQMVERWAGLAGDGHERALRLSRAAAFTARIDEDTRAHKLCERAHSADPTCLPARLALAASHRRRGELGRADQLIAAALAGDDAGNTELTCELAALREAEGDLAGALAQHRALLAQSPDDVAARRRACALALRLHRHAEALELAAPLPDDGPTEVRLERWLLVSRAAHASGDRALASEASARAAELAPDRLEVRRLRAEQLILDGRADEAQVIVAALDAERDQMTLADRTALAFLAGECARGCGDGETALARYREAIAFDPAHRAALRASLDLAVELERWPDSLVALDALVSLERDRTIRARYRHLAGHVCEENLGDDESALMHYRAALADDADHPRCAERLESLFRRRGDFGGLAEHCARALERLGERGDVTRRARLWSVLADAATGLGDRDGTIAALEVVARLDPLQTDARRRLASLWLQAGPDAADKAIVAQHDLLRLDPAHVPAYRALSALYEQTGRIARAEACERAALFLTARENPGDRSRIWAPAPELATRPLTPADWSLLQHPDEDRSVSLLAGLVAPLLAATAAVPMDRARRWPGVPVPRNDMRPFVQAANHVARILGLPTPELFVANDQMAPMRFHWASVKQAVRPVVVIGVPLLGDRRRMADLVPAVALDMVQLRPERNLRLFVHDPEVLALIMRAVVAVAHDEEPAPEAKVTASALKRWMPPVALDQLVLIGRRLRIDGHDLTRLAAEWLHAADLTAARAALVMTGDLERTMAAVEARASDDNAARGATKELIWASITDELWTVRDRLIHAAEAPRLPSRVSLGSRARR